MHTYGRHCKGWKTGNWLSSNDFSLICGFFFISAHDTMWADGIGIICGFRRFLHSRKRRKKNGKKEICCFGFNMYNKRLQSKYCNTLGGTEQSSISGEREKETGKKLYEMRERRMCRQSEMRTKKKVSFFMKR